MTMDGRGALTGDLSSKIVGVLAETLQRLQQTLRPCCMSGREHYAFSLRHMIIAIQSLRMIDTQTRNQASFVAPFLKHELYRIAYDQIVREIDQHWFNDTINEIFRNVNGSFHLQCLHSSGALYSFILRRSTGIRTKKIIAISPFRWKEEAMSVH